MVWNGRANMENYFHNDMNREEFAYIIQEWPQQWNSIQELVRSGTMHHGYAITGSADAPLHLFIESWSALVLCTNRIASTDNGQPCGKCPSCLQFNKHLHPDLLLVQPEESKALGIDSAQRIRDHLFFTPVLSTKRIVLIYDAHLLTTLAANALLKITEEPPASGVILLSTIHGEQLPATLRSRLQTIYLPPVTQQNTEIKDAEEKMVECKQFFRGDSAHRQQLIQQMFFQESDGNPSTIQLAGMIGQMEAFMRSLLLTQHGVEDHLDGKWNGEELHELAQQYSSQEIQYRLEQLHQCQEMLNQKVNKKMIIDYLITSL